MKDERIVLGAMTGTSLDGIDVAVARIRGKGLDMRVELIAHHSAGLGPLGTRLRAAAEQEPLSAGAFAALALDLGNLHAQACAEAWAKACAQGPHAAAHPALAAVHGQTIFHAPPLSWQLINPHPIVQALRCPVVFDLRGADLCEGGQGAPLTPLADWVLLRGAHPRAIVNLGGFANATFLPGAADPAAAHGAGGVVSSAADVAFIRGRDLCACNQLLDRAAREMLNQPFDRDGLAAMAGTANAEAVEEIAEHLLAPVGGESASRGNNEARKRSLGTGDEAWQCLARWQRSLDRPTLLASLADAIGLTIGRSLAHAPHMPREVMVAGGGARHARLLRAIRQSAGVPVRLSDELGVPIEQRECLGWAVLGALAQDGVSVSLAAVTGRARTLLADGSWCFPRDTSDEHPPD